MIITDYLVIGSGVAGLTFAVKIAEKFPNKTVTIITKGSKDESNTKYAQGGVAVVLDKEKDSFQKHIQDTLIAGDGLCDRTIVEMVVNEGPKRFKELITWGANFDINTEGSFDLGKEGGHSEYRVVHHKDITGYEIERALLQRIHQLKNTKLLSHHFSIDLITEHQLKSKERKQTRCYGAYVLNEKTEKVFTIKANNTILASGGIGNVYGHTTNPIIATGDGVAMAYRAKAVIKDMEFVQFHPTVLYNKEGGSSFLISEAVRGFGAYLRDKKGNRFMLNYDARGELASRDIVSQSIDKELKESGDPCVFLDCTHLGMIAFQKHFPTIYEKCKSLSIDVAKDWIPVVPASHYLCGGIVVDKYGKTTVQNLFCCGETSRTGLHGANRLASNSLLEALVYAHNIFKFLSENNSPYLPVEIPEWNDEGVLINKETEVIDNSLKELQALMRDYAGIVRSNSRLIIAKNKLEILYNKVEKLYKESKVTIALCELRNMINVAHLIINQSIERKENKGGFFNIDNTIKEVRKLV
ncbi:L-aspartate oxidase [Tenacibaculum ascidiaceicola]|uniref:L-aspartate oxidase n=1 Tax=Tenacibaculum ascidiaceicola TaxID=1699411 RepID=UPI003894CEDB